MPRARTQRQTKGNQSHPTDPKDYKQFVELLEKLHAAVNSGNPMHSLQAMPKLTELHERFPKNVNVLVLLGRGYMSLRNMPDSLAYYRRAAAIMPMDPNLNFQYGIALENAGHFEQAIDRFDRVLQKQPDHFFAMRHRVSSLGGLGRKEESYQEYLKIKEMFDDAELNEEQRNALAITAAAFSPEFIAVDGVVGLLEERVSNSKDKDLIRAGSAQLARMYKHQKKHEQAFEWYEMGKGIDKDEWDCERYSQRIDRLIDCWSNHEIPFSKAKNIDSSRVVFIVGMPRSGTSLTEQMLAQLRGIEPGGEMTVIDREIHKSERITMRHAPRLPLDHQLYSQAVIDAMSVNAMKGFSKVSKRLTVTYKQPYNYLMVPMIAHMLPGVKFIHCTRDALDCCFSNFTTAFTQLHMHTHDLYWLGRYYADYERVMRAWHELPEVEMIDLSYEKLVNDPETQMRRVVEFIGHEWDDKVLRFHESERTVMTASRDQVNKKLYTSAIKKYKPFEHRLDELKRGLEDGRNRPHGGS